MRAPRRHPCRDPSGRRRAGGRRTPGHRPQARAGPPRPPGDPRAVSGPRSCPSGGTRPDRRGTDVAMNTSQTGLTLERREVDRAATQPGDLEARRGLTDVKRRRRIALGRARRRGQRRARRDARARRGGGREGRRRRGRPRTARSDEGRGRRGGWRGRRDRGGCQDRRRRCRGDGRREQAALADQVDREPSSRTTGEHAGQAIPPGRRAGVPTTRQRTSTNRSRAAGGPLA